MSVEKKKKNKTNKLEGEGERGGEGEFINAEIRL
jgi:hypothetical protein